MINRYVTKKNTLLLIFILLHMFIIIYWGFYWNNGWENKEEQTVFNTVRYYVQPLGLWQNWNVFAPPPQVEVHILIQGNASGFLANYTPTYQTVPTKINNEYIRKWHENILNDRFIEFRMLYLEYWCRQFEKTHNKDFREVTLYIYHQQIPDLDSKVREGKKFIRKMVVEC
jgi:hypothetical protein